MHCGGEVPVDALNAGNVGFRVIAIVSGFKDSRVLFLSVFTGDIFDICRCRVRGHVLVLCTLQRSQRTTSIQLSENSKFQAKSTRHKPQIADPETQCPSSLHKRKRVITYLCRHRPDINQSKKLHRGYPRAGPCGALVMTQAPMSVHFTFHWFFRLILLRL